MTDQAWKLQWPPLKSDLERLYLVERLSAAKIAKAYGLNYASPKTAESTVLYHLKKNGIGRRGSTDHIRKVNQELVDAWIGRYEAGDSLKQIAGGSFSPVTVMHHLAKRGVKRRNKVVAQIKAVTKHAKANFAGDRRDQAYLVGFARGDLNVSRHGRAVRIKTATTHPMMVEHLENLFGGYGHVLITPRFSRLAGYEWSVQVDLDKSFSFLMRFRREAPKFLFGRELFAFFLAGFFDAEGSVWLNDTTVHGFEISITNSDNQLLDSISSTLSEFGLNPYMGRSKSSRVWKVYMWRWDDVERFLRLVPLRHPEKVAKARLALTLSSCRTPEEYDHLVEKWKLLIREIKSSRDRFVDVSRARIGARQAQLDAGR